MVAFFILLGDVLSFLNQLTQKVSSFYSTVKLTPEEVHESEREREGEMVRWLGESMHNDFFSLSTFIVKFAACGDFLVENFKTWSW